MAKKSEYPYFPNGSWARLATDIQRYPTSDNGLITNQVFVEAGTIGQVLRPCYGGSHYMINFDWISLPVYALQLEAVSEEEVQP